MKITLMETYQIILLVAGIAALGILLCFGIIYLISKNNKKKNDDNTKEYYKEIIELVGGIDNISEISSVGSRLTLVLNNNDLVDQNTLEVFKNKGIGIFRTSKKITLVIGDFASYYKEQIEKEKSAG